MNAKIVIIASNRSLYRCTSCVRDFWLRILGKSRLIVYYQKKTSVAAKTFHLFILLSWSHVREKIIINTPHYGTDMSTLENIEHKSMKQVSYSGKYSLSASRAHQCHLQFSFVVLGMLSVHAFYTCKYLIIGKKPSRLQKRIVDEIDELY